MYHFGLKTRPFDLSTLSFFTGKLVLKIPWKNLYGASVEATIDRLFLIVNPTAEVKYDPEKEEKYQLAAKQAELARVEEAKKQEAQKGKLFIYTLNKTCSRLDLCQICWLLMDSLVMSLGSSLIRV